jgi:Predicted transcriptional regulator
LRELRAALPVQPMMSGQAIKELRERLGLSQAMLAACVGMSVATIIKWEREEKNQTARRCVCSILLIVKV